MKIYNAKQGKEQIVFKEVRFFFFSQKKIRMLGSESTPNTRISIGYQAIDF